MPALENPFETFFLCSRGFSNGLRTYGSATDTSLIAIKADTSHSHR